MPAASVDFRRCDLRCNSENNAAAENEDHTYGCGDGIIGHRMTINDYGHVGAILADAVLQSNNNFNVPIGVYRDFRSLTDAPDALLMAIIGGPDAGKVDWHPSVLAEARKTGLSVDEEGNLIIEKPAA
jgi:hypothetical protein